MPIGGLGSRFTSQGILTPKPLISIDGRPLFLRAIDSFRNSDLDLNIILVVREDGDLNFQLGDRLSKLSRDAKIITFTGLTRGAVETALKSKPFLSRSEPVVIVDCDFSFRSLPFLREVTEGSSDGVLLSFHSRDPRYSYAIVDQHNFVTATAEKKVVSNHALMGAYFFRRAGMFIDAAEELLEMPLDVLKPELYMSMIYNLLIADGFTVRLTVGEFFSFGTPEEIARYLNTRSQLAES